MNEEDTNALLHPDLTDQGYVRLPVTPAQFKEFVASLLGSEQSIGGSFECGFTCDPALIQDFVNLIEQRITSQQSSALIDCKARFSFSDDTYAEISGFENIVTYHNLNVIEVIRLDLTLNFLVRFGNIDTPKKQNISISFFAFYDKYKKKQEPKITYEIKVSNQTFAYDIEYIIRNFIMRKGDFYDKIAIFLRKFEDYFFSVLWVLILIIPLYNAGTRFNRYTIDAVENQGILYEKLSTFEEKLDHIFYYYIFEKYVFVDDENIGMMWGFIVLAFIFFILLFYLYSFFLKKELQKGTLITPKLGFILFSDQSKKYQEVLRKRYKRSLFTGIFVIIIFPIVLGLSTNYIYDLLKK